MIYLAPFALGIWIIAFAFLLYGTYLARRKLNGSPPHLDAPFRLYPVSILKPLKGAENGIEENIRTFFNLKYPDFELLFSVANSTDPARAMVEKLMCEYPKIKAKLIIGHVNAGPNPKVNNLIKSYALAKNDLILISDSNVRVEPDYLKRLVAHLNSSVGIITAVVAGTNASTVGGKLESMYLNTFYARWMYLTEKFDQTCVVGKSMFFNRRDAERFGGIQALARYLAEDYMAGVAMRRLGLKVVVMTDPVPQFVGEYKFSDFWHRHLRWGRIRKSQAPLAFLVEPLLSSVVSGFLGAFAVSQLFEIQSGKFLLVHFAVWSLCDLYLARKLEKESHYSKIFTWTVRESLSFPLWFHTAIGNTVLWRGKNWINPAHP